MEWFSKSLLSVSVFMFSSVKLICVHNSNFEACAPWKKDSHRRSHCESWGWISCRGGQVDETLTRKDKQSDTCSTNELKRRQWKDTRVCTTGAFSGLQSNVECVNLQKIIVGLGNYASSHRVKHNRNSQIVWKALKGCKVQLEPPNSVKIYSKGNINPESPHSMKYNSLARVDECGERFAYLKPDKSPNLRFVLFASRYRRSVGQLRPQKPGTYCNPTQFLRHDDRRRINLWIDENQRALIK